MVSFHRTKSKDSALTATSNRDKFATVPDDSTWGKLFPVQMPCLSASYSPMNGQRDNALLPMVSVPGQKAIGSSSS